MVQHDSGSGQPKRTIEEINLTILAIVDSSYSDDGKKRGATKMKIMADAFVSSNSATEYLDKLQHDGLIEYHQDTHSYLTTEKRIQLLSESR